MATNKVESEVYEYGKQNTSGSVRSTIGNVEGPELADWGGPEDSENVISYWNFNFVIYGVLIGGSMKFGIQCF